jgi:predicted PurR-regulated permease PerM
MRARTVANVVIATLALLLVIFVSEIVLLLFAAILIAVLLRALAELLAKRVGIPPRWAVVIVVMLLALSFSAIGWLVAPSIGEQVTELRSALPTSLQRLQQELQRFVWLERLVDSAPHPDSIPTQPKVASKGTEAMSGTFKALANVVVVLVIALYLAADPRPYVEGTVRLFPPAQRKRAREVLDAMGHTLRWWLIGKAVSMTIVGIAVFIGLTALGVPLAGALALIAALLDFIPNVGPILALIPAALFALLQGPTQVLYVVVLYGAIQTLEGYVLSPLIDRTTVKLPPALTLTAMVVAALLFGWLGLLLAAPAAAALMVLVQMVYVEDTLGERDAR